MTITKLPTAMPDQAAKLTVPAEILVTASPDVTSFTAWRDADAGLSAGRWMASGFASIVRPYGTHELMVLVEGALTIVSSDGSETTVTAPGAIVVPKGLPCQWRHEGVVEKYFFILGGSSPISDAAAPVLVPFSNKTIGEDEITPVRERVYYSDPSGRYTVSLFEGVPGDRADHAEYNEFVYVADGELSIVEPDAPAVHLEQGEAAIVPAGTVRAWHSDSPVRIVVGRYA